MTKNAHTQAAGSSSSISLTSNVSTYLNQSFYIPVMINTDNVEIIGTDIVISFDTSYLELIDIRAHPENSTLKMFLPSSNIGTFDKREVVQNAKNTGIIEFGALCFLNGCTKGLIGQLTASNPLATLQFKALKKGNTSVNIVFTSGSTTDSNLVSRDHNDILSKVVDSSILISENNSASTISNTSPTPTRTPTLTPTPTNKPTPKASFHTFYNTYNAGNEDDTISPTPLKLKKVIGPEGYLKNKKKTEHNATVLGEKTSNQNSFGKVLLSSIILLFTIILGFIIGVIIFVKFYLMKKINKEISKNSIKIPAQKSEPIFNLSRQKAKTPVSNSSKEFNAAEVNLQQTFTSWQNTTSRKVKTEEKSAPAFSNNISFSVKKDSKIKPNNGAVFTVSRN